MMCTSFMDIRNSYSGPSVGFGIGVDLSQLPHWLMSAANADPVSDTDPDSEEVWSLPAGRSFHVAAGFSPQLLCRLQCHPAP